MKKTVTIFIAVIVVLALLFSCMGSSGGSSGGTGRCTICKKTATHTYQGSGYCDTHYRDAISWSLTHLK